MTTLPYLSGAEVERYENMISASRVIGTGFIADFKSSFSDMVGGESKVLVKKINKIKQGALDELEEQARKLRCNAILGVHIDVNDLSSNNMNMFMLTATGTPVQCRMPKHPKTTMSREEMRIAVAAENVISDEDLQALIDSVKDAGTRYAEEFEKLARTAIAVNHDPLVEEIFAELFVTALLKSIHVTSQRTKAALEQLDQELFVNKCLTKLNENADLLEKSRSILGVSDDYRYLLDHVMQYLSYEELLPYFKQADIVFESLVLIPMMTILRETYYKSDIEPLEQIVDDLTSSYWMDDSSAMNDSLRVTESGEMILRTANVGGKTISFETFRKREERSILFGRSSAR